MTIGRSTSVKQKQPPGAHLTGADEADGEPERDTKHVSAIYRATCIRASACTIGSAKPHEANGLRFIRVIALT
jgi:hypothetical protein